MPNGLFRLRNHYDLMPMQKVELRHQPCIGNTHRVVVSLVWRVSHKQGVCGWVDNGDHHHPLVVGDAVFLIKIDG